MNWTPVSLADLLELEYGKPLPKSARNSSGSVPVAGSNGTDGFHSSAIAKGPGIVVGRKGSAGKVTWFDSDFWPIDTTYFVRHDPKVTSLRWLYYLLLSQQLERLSKTTGVPGLNRNDVYKERCLLPTPKEQARIAALLDQAFELRSFRREVDIKANHVRPALFSRLFGSPGKWTNTEKLGKLVEFRSGGTPSKSIESYWKGSIPWVSPKDMKLDEIHDATDHISQMAVDQSAAHLVPSESVLIVVRGMILARDVPIAIARKDLAINQDMKALLVVDERVSPLYIFAALKAQAHRLLSEVTTAAHGTKKLDLARLEDLPIPIPSSGDLLKFTSLYDRFLALDRDRRGLAARVEQLFSVMLSRAFDGSLTKTWREVHSQELLNELRAQAHALSTARRDSRKYK